MSYNWRKKFDRREHSDEKDEYGSEGDRRWLEFQAKNEQKKALGRIQRELANLGFESYMAMDKQSHDTSDLILCVAVIDASNMSKVTKGLREHFLFLKQKDLGEEFSWCKP